MIALILLKIVLHLLRWNRLEFVGEGVLKGKDASLEEVKRFREFTLEPEKVSEVKQTFVMVEVPPKKLHHILNAHGRLHLLKLNLEYLVLLRLLEAEHLGPIVLSGDNLHRQELGRRSRPTLVRLREHEPLGGDNTLILRLIIVPLLHQLHPPPLLLRGSLHLRFDLLVNIVPLSSLLAFAVLESESSELLCRLRKELLELLLVGEVPPVHAEDGLFAADDDAELRSEFHVLALSPPVFFLKHDLLDDLVEKVIVFIGGGVGRARVSLFVLYLSRSFATIVIFLLLLFLGLVLLLSLLLVFLFLLLRRYLLLFLLFLLLRLLLLFIITVIIRIAKSTKHWLFGARLRLLNQFRRIYLLVVTITFLLFEDPILQLDCLF